MLNRVAFLQHALLGTNNNYCKILRRMASKLPPKPQPPSEEDCCDSGCALCVKDIYEQEIKIWKAECRRIQLKEAPRSGLSPTSYTKCPLISIDKVTHNTNLYTFDSRGYVEISPGQHMILRETNGTVSLTRQYTPVAVPSPTGHTMQFMIKSYSDGPMTSIIRKRWKLGYEAEWRGPHGLYLHQPDKYMKILMLAAGTGLAPMLNVADAVVSDDNDITTIKLLYACQKYEDLLLKARIKTLAGYWNFTYKYFLSQESQADVNRLKGYGENTSASKINIDELRQEITKPKSTRVLICGTRQFDNAMLGYLQELGIPNENIYKF